MREHIIWLGTQLEKERESLEGEKASCAEQWSLIKKEKQNVELFRKRSRDSSEGEAQRILDCISELEDHEEALREREEEIVGNLNQEYKNLPF